jgi:4-hydroxy-3-polyprenylbenzoate decarboxylase
MEPAVWRRDLPSFRDLRDFMAWLEAAGELVRIREPVSAVHEVTEIHRRALDRDGPALLFERPVKADGHASSMPLLVNLFGTTRRVAAGLGVEASNLAALGEALASIRQPTPPKDLGEAWLRLPLVRAALSMRPKEMISATCQSEILTGEAIDLARLPAQILWPGEPAPLITWPLVITRPPDGGTENVGVYRMQILGRDRAIMRWLAHRGGAAHHRLWQERGLDMPVAVAIGADPATMLAAAMPLPEGISELRFSGLLRGERPRLAPAASIPLMVPADAEIVIEGLVSATETAPEGPYGDHTGYYNAVEDFPVMRVTAMTLRRQPVYVSTFVGRPPDEPSRIGEAFNPLFVPLAQQHFPEIVDLWLPPEACSYRVAVIAIDKRYPGQARRVMLGLWSLLPQLTYTKLIIVVDRDVDIRDWRSVMWALSTRADPSRDLVAIDDTPIDYLDFASPKSGLGGKLGVDATNKIGTETERAWGRPLEMNEDVCARVDEVWDRLGIDFRSPARRPAA